MPLDFQILLLPRDRYWDWLRACRDYVLVFGPNLTPDPGVAARYMRPRQVVSFPLVDGGYPEIGDPRAWFRRFHDGIRLDPIDAANPEALAAELQRRIDDNDRYGAMRRPFHLRWPTDFPVVTQAFGANPQVYRRYGMPGHEGVDLRALTNTNVYACADGEVYEVFTDPKVHAYGIHIRIQHRAGYKTVYAHLARALVRKGEPVRAGQVIGRADSTGNSAGSHLHLSLKRDGATARGETNYPKDIIDPTPFLIWPAAKTAGAKLPQATRVGLNLVRPAGLTTGEIAAAASSRAGIVLIADSEPRESIDALRAALPGVRLVARLAGPLPDEARQPARFVAGIAGEIGRLYRLGVHDFEPAPYPNEVRGGLGRLWTGGESFAEWYTAVVRRLREPFPEARFAYPTLATGGDVTGRQQEAERFLGESEAAVEAADWIASPLSVNVDLVAICRAYYPSKPIVVSEVEPRPGESAEARAIRVAGFLRGPHGAATTAVLFDPRSSDEQEARRGPSAEAIEILTRASDAAGVPGSAPARLAAAHL